MLFGGETAQSYYEEGLTAAMKGSLEQAIRYFERAWELDAELYSAQHQIGRCLLRQGNGAAALPRLELAVTHLPDLIPPQLDLGFVLLQLNRLDAARDVFSGVLAQKPNESRAVLGLAYCAFKGEQWVTTMNLAEKAIELGRNKFDTHFLLAQAADSADILEVATVHYQTAASLMDRSIEATPEQCAGYYLRGRVYFAMQHFGPALEDVDTALKYVEKDRLYSTYNEIFSRSDILALKDAILQKTRPRQDAAHGMEKHAQQSPNP